MQAFNCSSWASGTLLSILTLPYLTYEYCIASEIAGVEFCTGELDFILVIKSITSYLEDEFWLPLILVSGWQLPSEMRCVGEECLLQFGGRSTSHVASSDCYVLNCVRWVWHKASTVPELNMRYGKFTPRTRTRHDCLVLSVSAVWTELETSQDCLRLTISKQFCPVSKCGVNWVLSGSHIRSHRRQDKTVLSPRQSCLVRVRGVN